MVIGDLKLFAPVQVRNVNFFEPATAGRNVSDSGIENAGNSGELIDNLVDELVSDAPIVLDAPRVPLTDSLLVLKDIEEPQLHGDIVSLHREAALHQAFSSNGRPILEIERAQRNTGLLRILEIGRSVQDVEPAGEIEVVNYRVGDSLRKFCRVRCRS